MPSALPVKVSADVVDDDPANVGTPAGQLSVCVCALPAPLVPVTADVPFVPAYVHVAEPPVLLAVDIQRLVGPPLVEASSNAGKPLPVAPLIELLIVSTCTWFATQLDGVPVNVCAAAVRLSLCVCADSVAAVGTPAGQAMVPLGVTVPVLLVPAGVQALTAELATLLPVNVGAAFVPAGVIVSLPPVEPTFPLAIVVAIRL